MSLLDNFFKKPVKKEIEKKGEVEVDKNKKEVIQENKIKTEGKNEEKKNERKEFTEGMVTTKDIIAPSSLEVDFNHVRIDNKYYRTLFVASYPRFVSVNWLSSLINFDATLSISMFVYPTDGKEILDDLRRKITEMEAEIASDIQRGRLVNPATQAKLEDAMNLQADLVKGEERFFQFGLYITIAADSEEEVEKINKNLEAALGSLLIVSKRASLQMEDGFVTGLPLGDDRLKVTRNMDTTSLATTFPFVSSDLSDDKGIMYGINNHNGSLVIFDRFSMPNYNSVVFAMAGAGKSYMIKLEALRSLMMGTEIIVIDPENEYKDLADAVGGQYIAFGYGEDSKINPFDLTLVEEEGENALNTKVLSLHKMIKVMLGELDPIEESIIDKAMMAAYKAKGITPDPATQKKEAPLIEDLYKALIGMEEEKSRSLAARLEKFIRGSFAGIFNQKTTVNLKNNFVVFGIKNLEESLRPVAMHIILDYIWTVVRKNLKKRILIVDEAWYLMQYKDSASFLRGIVKRGRKYYLGVTTITQDVDDFLATPYGKEIVTNSAIQILLKQHSAAIDQIGEVFYLSEGEKQLLLSADKGQGIFFAGQNHVSIDIISSEDEHNLITSDPKDVLEKKQKILNEKGALNKEKENVVQSGTDIDSNKDVSQKVSNEIPKANLIPEKKDVEQIEKKTSESINKTNEVNKSNEAEAENIKEEVVGGKFLQEVKLERQNKASENVVETNNEVKNEKIKDSLDKGEFKLPQSEIVSGKVNNPMFIRNEERKIPQPKQLSKSPQAVFEEKKEKKPVADSQGKKMDYKDLFNDEIV